LLGPLFPSAHKYNSVSQKVLHFNLSTRSFL
jgi:hypothetical protein